MNSAEAQPCYYDDAGAIVHRGGCGNCGKITPGPWLIHPMPTGNHIVHATSKQGREVIADVFKNDANARLIALAPAMLSAIEYVEEFFARLEDLSPDDPLRTMREKYHAPVHSRLRPLIAEARGTK